MIVFFFLARGLVIISKSFDGFDNRSDGGYDERVIALVQKSS